MLDRHKLIESTQKTLARRQKALQTTLDELAFLDALPQSPEVSTAISATRIKRDRQNNTCIAAQALITALQAEGPQRANKAGK